MFYKAELLLKIISEYQHLYLNGYDIIRYINEKISNNKTYYIASSWSYIKKDENLETIYNVCDYLVELGFLEKKESTYKSLISEKVLSFIITGIPDHEKTLNYIKSCEYEYFSERELLKFTKTKEVEDIARCLQILYADRLIKNYVLNGRQYLYYFCLNTDKVCSHFTGTKLKPKIIRQSGIGKEYIKVDFNEYDELHSYIYGVNCYQYENYKNKIFDLDDDFDNFSDSNLIIGAVKYKVSNEVTDEVTGMSYEVCDRVLTPYNCDNYDDVEDFSDNYGDVDDQF